MNDSVRIPADIDREDRILAGFTARQVAVMAVTGVVLYAGWLLLRAMMPAVAYVTLAVPVAVGVLVLVVVRRDGLTLDRLLLAALRQRLQPRTRLAPGRGPEAVPGWLSAAQRQQQPAFGEGAIVKTCGWGLLGGGGWGVVVGAFDESAGFEAGACADESDEVRCVDRAPAALG